MNHPTTSPNRPSPTRNRARAGGLLALAAVTLAAAGGCAPPERRLPETPLAEVTPHELLLEHNRWAGSIEHIWSRAHVFLSVPRLDAQNPDAPPERDTYDVDGHVFLDKPHRFLLQGAVLGKPVFRLGMNAERYWLWVNPEVNTAWMGRRGGPGERELVFSPPTLVRALGVYRITPPAEGEMRLESAGPHAVLSEYAPRGGWLVRRTWFDRRTYRPARVDLYAPDGRRLVMAEVLEVERIGPTDVPVLYRCRFYGQGKLLLLLELKKVDLEKRLSARVFEFRVPPGTRIEDLDAMALERGNGGGE